MENLVEHLQNLIENNQFEEAEKQAQILLQESPDNLEVKIALARMFVIQTRNEEAVPLLEDIIKNDNKNYYPLYLLAITKERQEKISEAIDLCNRALKINPNNGNLYYRLAMLNTNLKNKTRDEQSSLYNLRRSVTSDNPPRQAFLALAARESLSRSVYILQSGLSQYPQDEDMIEALCRKYYSLEEYAKCIETIDDAFNYELMLDSLQRLKALALYKLKQYKDSYQALQKVNYLNEKQELPIKAFAGLLLCEAGEYKEAEIALEKIVAEDVGNRLDYTGHIILCYCCLKNSEYEKAEKFFNEIPDENVFTSPLLLYFDDFLELDSCFLTVLDSLISRGGLCKNKARYLRLVYNYSPNLYEDHHSSEQLGQYKAELIELANVFEPPNFYVYEFLYHVSRDLKHWGDAANYYVLSHIHSSKHLFLGKLDDKVLENISKNKKSIEKFFSFIDQKTEEFGYYQAGFIEVFLSQILAFFHSKQRYDLVVQFAEKFSYTDVLKAKSVFEVAYAYNEIKNKKQALDYYRAYLRDVGENFAVANNLALLEEDAGNLAEAERLLQLAMKLDVANEKGKNNYERIIARISEEDEKKRAYQKAADLYRQELEATRLLAAKLYSLKTDDGLILCNHAKLASISDLDEDEVDFLVEELLKKKYFDEIFSKSIQFDGRILRVNPAIASLLESDLRKFEERDVLKAISNELLSENLDIKYGYNQLLLDKLSFVNSTELSKMLERDLYETIVALAVKSYKSALILCGSIAESVLLDAMLARKDSAIKALERLLAKENKTLKSDDAQLNRWVLDRLLDVALEMNLVSENLYHWGHGLRGFRNLVHPGVEQRQSIEVSRENAEMAWNVVKRLLTEIKAKEKPE